jgi:hypothetical protein
MKEDDVECREKTNTRQRSHGGEARGSWSWNRSADYCHVN